MTDRLHIYEAPTAPARPAYTYANRTVYRQGGLVVAVAHGVSLPEAHDRLRAAHGDGYRLDVVRQGEVG